MKALVIRGSLRTENATAKDAVFIDADGNESIGSLPKNPTVAQYEEAHLFDVTELPKPDGEKVEPAPWIMYNGVPTTQWSIGTYTPDERIIAIAELKNKLRGDAKVRRLEALDAGTVINGMAVSTSDTARMVLTMGMSSMARNPTRTRRWQMDDGSWVTLNKQSVEALFDAVDNFIDDCYNNDESIRTAIDSATTLAELKAIDVNTGWPT